MAHDPSRCSVVGCGKPEEWHTISFTANYIITVRYCERHLQILGRYIHGAEAQPPDIGTIDPELSFKAYDPTQPGLAVHASGAHGY